jgi:hypothetical protein
MAANAHLQPVSTVFIELMSMLKARKDVAVPPLLPEPKVEEIHFSVAGQSFEADLFQHSYPGQLQNFLFQVNSGHQYPPRQSQKIEKSETKIQTAEIEAITSALLGKLIKSVLTENFEDDVKEVLKETPNLFYVDILKADLADTQLLCNRVGSAGDFTATERKDKLEEKVESFNKSGNFRRINAETSKFHDFSSRFSTEKAANLIAGSAIGTEELLQNNRTDSDSNQDDSRSPIFARRQVESEVFG